MADKYWIKLYHEILHDRKMQMLPGDLFKFAINTFLLAGEEGRGGLLPPVADIAWILRLTENEVNENLAELAKSGMDIVRETEEGWIVTKFEKRQSSNSNAERVQHYRDAKQKEQYYCNEDVTDLKQNVTQIKNTDTEKEEEEDAKPASPSLPPSNFPFDVTEQKYTTLLMTITGNMYLTPEQIEYSVPIVQAIERKIPGDIDAYLRPYWKAWRERNYNKTNYSWLEWAAGGEIPAKKNGKGESFSERLAAA